MTWFEIAGLILVAVLVGALVSALVLFNIRRVRTRRVADALPEAVRSEALALIDRAGLEDGTRVLLLRVIASPGSDPYSRIGGKPLLSPGWVPPETTAQGGSEFLAQVRLQSPPLPAIWSNRVVFLFCDATRQLVARSSAGVDPVDSEWPATAWVGLERGVETLRLPPGDVVDNEPDDIGPSSPYAPGSLCRRIPALRQILAGYDRPERLLPHILVPGIGTHEIDTFLVCLMGGEPELIQGEHGAACRRCSRPMRFLLQLGDVLGLAGDAPVVYIYGCDEHPEELDVYLDMH